ncbi:MAG: heavy metal translocating P-type ATPase [Oscillospiraceae bacterium]|nr:heavy metal translocating P-type ATPase [Oscillospiraceae bacterium]MBR3556683.1 heavy metal translocating P-type ATPase [Oscillospiraceae bacterium]
MRFLILHESSGRMRLRAELPQMTLRQADLLDAWLRGQAGVEQVTVHERTCGVTVLYRGDRSGLCAALAGFSWEKAERSLGPEEHSSRAMNREYKEKLVMMAVRHYARRLLLPAPLRHALSVWQAIPRILRALQTAAKGKLTVDVLDGVAIGVSLLTGDYATAGSVGFLLKLGETLDEWTHKKSVEDLARSMSLQVDQVWLLDEDGNQESVPLAQVSTGDRIIVHTGHVLPLDGILESGDVMLNQASLTGESVPVAKRPGAAVYAGSVVEEGNCVLRVTGISGESRYDRIVRMIEDSQRLKSGVENRAGRLADKLVPWCLGGSLLTWLLTGNTARAVSVLMVDFSCALKLSMPLSVLSAMREAGRHRVTVKGGKYMEKVSEADTVIFDKTGTLTRACPTLREVVSFHREDEKEMLRFAACLEEHFPHSVANAVVRAALERGLDHSEMHSEVEYVVAHGIATKIDGKRAAIGSSHFIFEDEGAVILPEDRERFEALSPACSWLYLAIDGILSAAIGISDPLRPEAKSALTALHEAGIGKTVMLTGDSRSTAAAIASQLGIDDYRAEVLPEDKADYIRSEQAAGRTVLMIGDGINDTPALSLADVGIAVGSGAVIAREVADVTIAAEDLHELVWLKRLSDALMGRIHRNYRFVMGFNGALILLGAFGLLPPAVSALMHNASTLLLSVNCLTDLLEENEDEIP